MRLNTATSHISVSVHRHGTKHMDSNPCVDSVFHPRRFTEHGTPTRGVGARGFANWSKVSRNGSRIRELDSQTRNCNTRQRPIFTGFSVRRPPTHALQFSDPVSSRTRHIQKPVRKPGTYTPASTHCKDSDPHLCRFTKPGAPTTAADNRRSVTQSATIGALLNASADCKATPARNLAGFSA